MSQMTTVEQETIEMSYQSAVTKELFLFDYSYSVLS